MHPTKILFLILVILASLFEAMGDIFLKKWSMASQPLFFILGIFVYIIATLVWAFSLRYEMLSKAIVICSIVNLLVVILAGVFLFSEQLSLINKFGIIIGVIAVILLQF